MLRPHADAPLPRLSACVITRNEAANIADCLRSLSFCDEIVVVDSHSTDETRAIAESFGARVITRTFTGYRSQKQAAVDAARHDWVLCLDADERIGGTLRASIDAVRAKAFGGAAGFRMARCTEYYGRPIRRGNGYPDRKLRLFDRRRARWGGREIHEKVVADGTVESLRGDIEHHAYRHIGDQWARRDRYATLMARALHHEGRRAYWWNLCLSPLLRFLRGYVLRFGFLDGWRGWALACVGADNVYRKYMRLWLLDRGLPIDDEPVSAGVKAQGADDVPTVEPAPARGH